MNTLIQAPMAHEVFRMWLEANNTPLQINCKDSRTVTVITFPKTEQISYLFCQDNYKGTSICMDDPFHFCGIYSRQDQTLHLVDGSLCSIISGLTSEECMNSEALKESFCSQVNQRIEEIIAEDRRNLAVQRITDSQMQHQLKYCLDYGASESAVRLLFAHEEPDIRFHSSYTVSYMDEEAILAYIQSPDAIIQMEAEQYIKSHQEVILLEFLRNDALRTEYQALMRNTGSPLHRMKAITEAITASGAKTVTVTIQKEGTVLTFKTAADSLTGHRTYYSTYQIPASDRRRFEQLFGRHASYSAEDITRITYGKKTIYEASPVQTEELVGRQGPTMQMGGM